MYERGYDAVTLADVAEAAGLARTAMYNYVPDKETLLIEFAARETDRYVGGLREALREVDNPVTKSRCTSASSSTTSPTTTCRPARRCVT